MVKEYQSKRALRMFWSIMAFSLSCLLLAFDISLGCYDIIWDFITKPIEWMAELLLVPARYLDPLMGDDTRTSVFGVLGLAASIIPPVYNAEATRRRGVMLREMIDCYFPYYKFVLVVNFILSMAGEYITKKNQWTYLFLAIVVTVLYGLVLLLASGFSEKVCDSYMQRFIKKKVEFLCNSPLKDLDEVHKAARIDFLADISSYLAQEISKEKTDFRRTRSSLRDNLRLTVNLILTETEIATSKDGKTTAPCEVGEEYSLQQEFRCLLVPEGKKTEDFCSGLYFQIPYCVDKQAILHDHADLARIFWTHILASAPSKRAKADMVCRVYDAIGYGKMREVKTGRDLVLCCGLLLYLYRESRMSENGSTESESTDYCARFVDEMRSVYLTSRSADAVDATEKDLLEQIIRDHMLLVWCISETEQYLQGRQKTSQEAARIIYSYAKDVSNGVIWGAMYDESIKFYLSLAMSLIQRLPSPANRYITLQQKRGLMAYLLNRKEKIGAWNDVYQ